jgi:hypothetical protein
MTTPEFRTWAVVELFGHVTLAGEVSEQTLGGSAFIRLDVPEVNGQSAFTNCCPRPRLTPRSTGGQATIFDSRRGRIPRWTTKIGTMTTMAHGEGLTPCSAA